MENMPFFVTPLSLHLSSFTGYTELEELMKLLVSSYGPKGRIKMLLGLSLDHNCTNGHSPSSSFVHILKNWQVTTPFVRVLISAANNHLSIYGDGGKFITIFAIAVLKNLSSMSIDRYILTKMFDRITDDICKHLYSRDCSIMVRVELDELHKIRAVVHTIITSKPGCNLSCEESTHLSILILKGFLNCIPCYTEEQLNSVSEAALRIGSVHFHTVEGRQPLNSSLTSGLVFQYHNVESTKKIVSKWKADGMQVFSVILFVISLDGGAIFGGESLEMSYGLHVEETVAKTLNALGQQLIKHKVNIVACQKVVHPILISYLTRKHCLVLDRLGTEMTEVIKILTGAAPLSSPELPLNCQFLGTVHDVKMMEYGGKEFLYLNSVESRIYTILLCNLSEELLVETKLVCQQALQALYRLTRSKQALLGGGCAESVMAVYVRKLVERKLLEYCSSLKCSKEQLTIFSEMFASVLEEIAVISYRSKTCMRDDTYYHLWEEEASSECCMCGMLKRNDPLINNFVHLNSQLTMYNLPVKINGSRLIPCGRNLALDESSCRINAWRVALETTSLLLNTGLYIKKD